MIGAGHLDLTVLGGLQVSATGDLANWMVPGKLIPGFGGALDLVGSGSRVIVTMDHVAKDGTPKILSECSFPLTGKGVVDEIITDKAVFQVDKIGGNGLILTEVARGETVDDIRAVTGCDFKVADNLSFMDDFDDKYAQDVATVRLDEPIHENLVAALA
jgi:3-oxoacid CoA-transferase